MLGSHGRVDWLATMQRERRGSDATVHPSLSALQAKELLAVEGESWEFHSELVREVAYGTMTKQMRAKVHAGVASYLEREEFEHHEAVIDSIAHHYGRAAALSIDLGGASGTLDDTVARAVDWLRRAGKRAARADTHGGLPCCSPRLWRCSTPRRSRRAARPRRPTAVGVSSSSLGLRRSARLREVVPAR